MKSFILMMIGLLNLHLSLWAQQGPRLQNEGTNDLLVVIDRSGSMIEEMPRVKDQVNMLMKEFPQRYRSGLIHFSGCEDERIKYQPKMARKNNKKVVDVAKGLEAGGATALARTLQFAHNVMVSEQKCPNLVVFTDEMDTCNGNPGAIRKQNKKFCLKVSFITAATDQEILKTMEDLSEKTGGHVYQAETEEQTREAIRELIDNIKKGQSRKTFTGYKATQKSKKTTTKKGTGDKKTKKDNPKDPAKAKASQKQTKSKGRKN